jgi:hypothetical protein
MQSLTCAICHFLHLDPLLNVPLDPLLLGSTLPNVSVGSTRATACMKRILELSQRMGDFECCEVRVAATRTAELERTLQEKEAEMAAKDAEMAAKDATTKEISGKLDYLEQKQDLGSKEGGEDAPIKAAGAAEKRPAKTAMFSWRMAECKPEVKAQQALGASASPPSTSPTRPCSG